MNHDAFVDHVRSRAHLGSREDAESAIKATLRTFGERLQPFAAAVVASHLPPEIGRHLDDHTRQVSLSLAEFYDRVAERERADIEKAKFHSSCVLATLCEAIAYGEVQRLRQQLPEEFRPLLHYGQA